MKTIRKSGHTVRLFLEGLATVFDLGGFLHPQPSALGDFSEDADATRSDWASVIPVHASPPPGHPAARRTSPEKPQSRTPGQDQNLPN